MQRMYVQLSLALGRLLDLDREEGQGATEYGLVLAVVVLTLAASAGLLGTEVADFLGRAADQVDALFS
jgi:Flp pilus assembly pilin Flp